MCVCRLWVFLCVYMYVCVYVCVYLSSCPSVLCLSMCLRACMFICRDINASWDSSCGLCVCPIWKYGSFWNVGPMRACMGMLWWPEYSLYLPIWFCISAYIPRVYSGCLCVSVSVSDDVYLSYLASVCVSVFACFCLCHMSVSVFVSLYVSLCLSKSFSWLFL